MFVNHKICTRVAAAKTAKYYMTQWKEDPNHTFFGSVSAHTISIATGTTCYRESTICENIQRLKTYGL